jgi:hypothetical protein
MKETSIDTHTHTRARARAKCISTKYIVQNTLIGGLRCAGFINAVGVLAGVWKKRIALSIWPN